jgi:hypothetical protein
MGMNMSDAMAWVTAQVTPADKALLGEITRQDAHETGTVANQSATLRRLIRQEAKRRGLNSLVLLEQEAAAG